MVALLGQTPVAIRIVSAILGTLTIPAAYLLFRSLYNRNIALLGAAVLAITVWPIQLSRIGFRAVALPLLAALALWLLWGGVKSGKAWRFALAGAVYGLSFYTYLAARFTPIALGICLILWAIRKRGRLPWRNLLVFAAAALVVLSPLGVYVGTHWDSFSARAGQVSVFNPAINGGDLWGTLARHAAKVAGMFNIRGDFIPRHNIPLRPVFDPLLGAAFLLGVIVALARRSPADGITLVWVAVMLVPTLLAEDAPHFLRGVGILPVVFVFPAIGLDWLRQVAARRFPSAWASALVALILAVGLGFTACDYFFRYANDPGTGFAFETGAAELAADTNAYLGTGWQGGWSADHGEPATDREVFIAQRIWEAWPSLRFLLADAHAVRRLDGSQAAAAASRVRLVVWPYEPYAQHLNLLPQGSAISVMQGPLERGDLEKEPRLVSIAFDAQPASETAALPIVIHADLGGLFRLAGAQVKGDGASLRLTLLWQSLKPTDVNYMVFVHVQQPGFPLTAGDGPTAQGYYSTNLWRAGDWIIDERVVELPAAFDPARDQVTIGMYDLTTLQRLPVTDSAGSAAGDSILIHP
jgi:4-amino-4-deoxy-L-arabinose transferase-like glycosyltransferase